ncbi:MAG: hypothetical protein P1V36_04440, partial [Planctomycetota bacterium]|nr:hypothetical protein [Planctomycetota bacterium]
MRADKYTVVGGEVERTLPAIDDGVEVVVGSPDAHHPEEADEAADVASQGLDVTEADVLVDYLEARSGGAQRSLVPDGRAAEEDLAIWRRAVAKALVQEDASVDRDVLVDVGEY